MNVSEQVGDPLVIQFMLEMYFSFLKKRVNVKQVSTFFYFSVRKNICLFLLLIPENRLHTKINLFMFFFQYLECCWETQ